MKTDHEEGPLAFDLKTKPYLPTIRQNQGTAEVQRFPTPGGHEQIGHVPQEAWSEKVLALCFEDFRLLFLYLRTLNHKMT